MSKRSWSGGRWRCCWRTRSQRRSTAPRCARNEGWVAFSSLLRRMKMYFNQNRSWYVGAVDRPLFLTDDKVNMSGTRWSLSVKSLSGTVFFGIPEETQIAAHGFFFHGRAPALFADGSYSWILPVCVVISPSVIFAENLRVNTVNTAWVPHEARHAHPQPEACSTQHHDGICAIAAQDQKKNFHFSCTSVLCRVRCFLICEGQREKFLLRCGSVYWYFPVVSGSACLFLDLHSWPVVSDHISCRVFRCQQVWQYFLSSTGLSAVMAPKFCKPLRQNCPKTNNESFCKCFENSF